MGFPGGSVVKNMPAGDVGSIPGLGRSLEKGMAAHSDILAWESSWTESLVGYSPWVTKESDVTLTKQQTTITY